MYLLFVYHHMRPSEVMALGYGERQILYAFVRCQAEENKKEPS